MAQPQENSPHGILVRGPALGAGSHPLPFQEPLEQVPGLAQRRQVHQVRQMCRGLPLRGPHQGREIYLRRPKSYLCLGPACQKNDFYCVSQVPDPGPAGQHSPRLQHPGRQPLARGSAPSHLVAGGMRHPALHRPGVPPGRLRRRLRQDALPVSQAPGQGLPS